MTRIEKLITVMKRNPRNVKFNDLVKVCNHYFGEARHRGGSHHVYRTPWQGDPRINIQNKKGKAKAYQVRQVLQSIELLETLNNDEE